MIEPHPIDPRRRLGQDKRRHRGSRVGEPSVRAVDAIDQQLRVAADRGHGLHLAPHAPEQDHIAGIGDGAFELAVSDTQAGAGEEDVDGDHVGTGSIAAPDQLRVNAAWPVGDARRQTEPAARFGIYGYDHRLGRRRPRAAARKQPRQGHIPLQSFRARQLPGRQPE